MNYKTDSEHWNGKTIINVWQSCVFFQDAHVMIICKNKNQSKKHGMNLLAEPEFFQNVNVLTYKLYEKTQKKRIYINNLSSLISITITPIRQFFTDRLDHD